MDVELGRVGGRGIASKCRTGEEVSLYVSLDLANTIEEAGTGYQGNLELRPAED